MRNAEFGMMGISTIFSYKKTAGVFANTAPFSLSDRAAAYASAAMHRESAVAVVLVAAILRVIFAAGVLRLTVLLVSAILAPTILTPAILRVLIVALTLFGLTLLVVFQIRHG